MASIQRTRDIHLFAAVGVLAADAFDARAPRGMEQHPFRHVTSEHWNFQTFQDGVELLYLVTSQWAWRTESLPALICAR